MHRAFQAQVLLLDLSFAHLLTGKRNYLERAWRELECWMERWKSWEDPHHAAGGYDFDLMVSGVGMMFSIAYDWLYRSLTPERRAAVRHALGSRVLDLYLRETAPGGKQVWWFRGRNVSNWNAVCNGGAILTALALRGEHPGSTEVIHRALDSVRHYFHKLGNEGGSEEGFGYWYYGMIYAVTALAALDRAGMPTRGLLHLPLFRRTGQFPIDFQPGRAVVGWGDVRNWATANNPIMYWLGSRYRMPELAAWEAARERAKGRATVFSILWGPAANKMPSPDRGKRTVRGRFWREIGWSVFADSWSHPRLVAGFKCGDLGASHTHLDNNSFSIWANGDWLAHDLGPPPMKYYANRYFAESRWGWYCVKTVGHNGLLVNGRGQLPGTKGRLWPLPAARECTGAVGDASRNYGPTVRRALRHFVVTADSSLVVILDEVRTRRPSTLEWRLHSPAPITVRRNQARVGDQAKSLRVLFPSEGMRLRTLQNPPGCIPGRTVDIPRDNVLCARVGARSRTHLLPAVIALGNAGARAEASFSAQPRILRVLVRTGGKLREFRWRPSRTGWIFAGMRRWG